MSRIDKNDAPSLTVIRFPNLMGALVLVTARERGHRTNYSWKCTGCLHEDYALDLSISRDEANAHSATCRALPQPERTDSTAA